MQGAPTTTVVGNLVADPELRALSNGNSVASFTIANTPRTYNRNNEEWQDGETFFVRCSLFRAPGEHFAASAKKGQRVIALGELTQRSYQDKDGATRTSIELQVEEVGLSNKFVETVVLSTKPTSAPKTKRQGKPIGGQFASQVDDDTDDDFR